MHVLIDLLLCTLTSAAPTPDEVRWRFAEAQLREGRLHAARGDLTAEASAGAAFERANDVEWVKSGGQLTFQVEAEQARERLPREQFTTEAWVRVDATPSWQGIVSVFQDNGLFEKGWMLGLHDQRFCFGLSTEGADDGNGLLTYIESTTNVVVGRWYHVAATYDGLRQALWIDGVMEAQSFAQHGPVLYPQSLHYVLMSYRDDNETCPLHGALYEVRMTDRATSASDLQQRVERRPALPVTSAAAPEPPPASVAEAGWPQHRHDVRRSAATPEELDFPLSPAWTDARRRAPRPTWPEPAPGSHWQKLDHIESRVVFDRAHPLVASEGLLVYSSAGEDLVAALDGATGEARWHWFADAPIRFAPAIAGGAVYVGADDGRVHCLDAGDGALRWSQRVAETDRGVVGNGRVSSAWPVRTGLVIDGEQLFVGAGLFPGQGVFLASFELADGEAIWRHRFDSLSPQGELLLSPQRLYVPTGRTNPIAFDRQSGSELVRYGGVGGCWTLLTEDTLLSGPGNDGSMVESDAAGRDTIAQFKGRQLVVDGGVSFLQTDTQLSAIDRDELAKLQRRRNTLAGQHDAATARLDAEEDARDIAKLRKILREIDQEWIAVAQALTKCVRWKVENEHRASLAVVGNAVIVGGEGEVVAYDRSSGRRRWRAKVEGAASDLAVEGGRLYVSTDRGRIHAFAPGRPAFQRHERPEQPRDDDTETAAAAALELLALDRGHAIVAGLQDGLLARELARRSELQVLGLDRDPETIRRVRERARVDGSCGDGYSVRTADAELSGLPRRYANLLVSEDLPAGEDPGFEPAALLGAVRPCGGVVLLRFTEQDTSSRDRWRRALDAAGFRVEHDEGPTLVARRGAPAGGGSWSHPYADAANTGCSGDLLVGPDPVLTWFGGPGPRRMIDRHLRTGPPLFAEGTLLMPASDEVVAVDAYNGTERWFVEIPGSSRTGTPFDTGHFVASADSVYVTAGGACHVLDLETGRQVSKLSVPHRGPRTAHWGWIATVDDSLFGSAQRATASRREQNLYEVNDQYRDNQALVVSHEVFRLDRRSGRERWSSRKDTVVNSTLTVGGGRVYYAGAEIEDEDGRVPLAQLLAVGLEIVALDAKNGRAAWRAPIPSTELQHSLYFAYRDETLIVSGSRNLNGQVWYSVWALDATDGSLRWHREHANNRLGIGGTHGEQVHHPIVTSKVVIAEPLAYDLRTGERVHPSGRSSAWSIPGRGGCGTISGSERNIFYRDGNPILHSLDEGGPRQRLTRVSRPGCWISVLPAGGLVLLPEASSGCVCAYSIQTSMGFRAKDDG